jgi:hypothetical protein
VVVYRLLARRLLLPNIGWRRIAMASAFVGGSWLAVPTINALTGSGFQVSGAGPVFLLGRMAENGMLVDLLYEKCPNDRWQMCEQIESIPINTVDFLWGSDEVSPFQRNGGPNPDNIKEMGEIAASSMSSPYWLQRHAGEAGLATLRQLFLIDPTVILYLHLADAVGWSMGTHFPAEEGKWKSAKQQRGELRLREWLPGLQRWTIFASMLLLVVVVLTRDLRTSVHPSTALAGVVLGMGLLANAAVCGGLSIPHDRYQGRVIALVPILVALMLARPGLRAALGRRVQAAFSRSES